MALFEKQSDSTEAFFKEMFKQQLEHEAREKENERDFLLKLGGIFSGQSKPESKNSSL